MLTAMQRTRGPGVQDNWDLWLNVFVSVCVQHDHEQQYWSNAALWHVWAQSNPTCRLGISYTLCREENYVSLDWQYAGRETKCFQEYEGVQGGKVKAENSDVQDVNTEHQHQIFILVF